MLTWSGVSQERVGRSGEGLCVARQIKNKKSIHTATPTRNESQGRGERAKDRRLA
jgi:hypothetical protein